MCRLGSLLLDGSKNGGSNQPAITTPPVPLHWSIRQIFTWPLTKILRSKVKLWYRDISQQHHVEYENKQVSCYFLYRMFFHHPLGTPSRFGSGVEVFDLDDKIMHEHIYKRAHLIWDWNCFTFARRLFISHFSWDESSLFEIFNAAFRHRHRIIHSYPVYNLALNQFYKCIKWQTEPTKTNYSIDLYSNFNHNTNKPPVSAPSENHKGTETAINQPDLSARKEAKCP